MSRTLEKILGSAARVKIMRLFLLNPERAFDIEDVLGRAKVSRELARSEVSMMVDIGLLKKNSFFKDKIYHRRGKKKIERVRTAGWILDKSFQYLEPIQNLLINVSPVRGREITRRLNRVGKVKLIVISGIFIQNWDSRVDLLIVGDNLKKGTLENTVKVLEAEVGREVRYAAFETQDFQYRLGMYDKLLRDILDFPHETLIDKTNLLPSHLISE